MRNILSVLFRSKIKTSHACLALTSNLDTFDEGCAPDIRAWIGSVRPLPPETPDWLDTDPWRCGVPGFPLPDFRMRHSRQLRTAHVQTETKSDIIISSNVN